MKDPEKSKKRSGDKETKTNKSPKSVGAASGRKKRGPAAPAKKGAAAKNSGSKPAARTRKAAAGQTAGRRLKKKESVGAGLLSAVLILAIMAVLGLGLRQVRQYRDFVRMRDAVENEEFMSGTVVDGIDVSSMTLEQALSYWRDTIEAPLSGKTVRLSNGASFTAAELGYTSDYETVLRNVWSIGRHGSLKQRYARRATHQQLTGNYKIDRRLYDPSFVRACVEAIAAEIDTPAEDARVESFDANSFTYSFTNDSTGSQLDRETLYRDMCSALDAGGGTVDLPVLAVKPAVTREQIQSQYGMITYAVTNASSSNKNRLSNIKQALAYIHGTCLHPGDTFSFNGTVGKRTKERGFKIATAYSGGEVTEDIGGGICQVSTTLFNAAVKADLKIVERHCHSLVVGYVDKGKDATVNWDSQDLRFTNTSGDDIYIVCALTSDKRVRIGIFGKLLSNGESITVEAVTTSTIPYETVYQVNFSYPSGAYQVTQQGKDGYTAEAYKVRWSAKGDEIGRELLCKSTYKATKQIVEYGA